ncbi:heme biosynthesis HemY N-terminal domain-containing protein [Hahella ganghwensis]|uniref:heme biosynthesis HemY N-terminal domain-containing protein n=1 Tax=Hahella ganghwensis TaxID=286420 RepID=UPI0003747B94|nr:heme biosynthesis HemY N-terminal domain-containing protein [Hahella ganghwensis]
MNKTAVILLIALSLGAGLGFLIKLDPGYIRVSWYYFLMETNIWIGLALLVAFYFALNYLLYLLARTLGIRAGWQQWRHSVKHSRAQRKTTRGLLEYAEGNWKKAQRYLSSSAEKSETPLINYLAAAQAANELGNEKESDQLLQKAFESTPGGDVAIGVTQAQLQLARGQLEQCLSTLLRLRKRTPHHPFVLKLLQQVYSRLCDWQKLGQLIPELRKYRVLKEQELDQLEQDTWLNLLKQGTDDALKANKSEVYTQPLNEVWDKMPAGLRKTDDMVYAYASQLVRLGASGHAEALVRKQLRVEWSEELVKFYGKIAAPEVDKQLLNAENWLKERPNDAVLLLTLGRLCLRNQLWGKAREYFEASLKLKKSPEAYAELGRLLSHMDQHAAGASYLLHALEQGAPLPELPMPPLKAQQA